MPRNLQIYKFKGFKDLTGIKCFIISGTRNQNWIKFEVGFQGGIFGGF